MRFGRRRKTKRKVYVFLTIYPPLLPEFTNIITGLLFGGHVIAVYKMADMLKLKIISAERRKPKCIWKCFTKYINM